MRKVFLLLAVVLMLSSCEKPLEKFSAYYFDYFDTVTSITGYAQSREEFDNVCTMIKGELEEYHKLYTIYNSYEGLANLHTLNHAKQIEGADEKLIDLLEYSKEVYTLTGGKTNIAMGSVLSLWHNARTVGSNHPELAALPSFEKLKEGAEHTDIENLIIDRDNGKISLADEKMSLDVGAVAKGYATEMVAKMLTEKGYSGYILNVGGNVRTVGTKANGEKWTVGLENPNATGEDDAYLTYLYLADEAVVTSGSYQRYYIVDGEKYHHIIDPQTLMPSQYFNSVSVVCPDSGLGDALSTALFCMNFEEGLALIESIDNAEALWLLYDGSIKVSSGFDEKQNN